MGSGLVFLQFRMGFITEFMEKTEYETWRLLQYGKINFKPVERCNRMTMEEVAFSIRLNRIHNESLDCLAECGLSESECEKILYDMETKHYCPIPKGNGKYECPNCHIEVDREQKSCEGDDCCLDFVWRK